MVKVKKSAFWLLVAGMAIMLALVFAMLFEKVDVVASGSGLAANGWEVHFSKPVKKEAVDSEDVYVTDQNGKRVKARITLDDRGRRMHIKGLEKGEYVLHVPSSSIKGKTITMLSSERIKFTIHDTLEAAASAEELENYFKRAKKLMNDRFRHGDVMLESAESESSQDKASGGDSYSETNNQVAGVDEADIVKTNGQFVFSILDNSKVSIADISNPEQIKQTGAISWKDQFYANGLFLQDNLLIVLGDRMLQSEGVSNKETSDSMLANSMTIVRIYDVSNPGEPVFLRETGAEGHLNSARLTKGVLYFVTNLYPQMWRSDNFSSEDMRPRITDSKIGGDSQPLDYTDISILPGAIEPVYSVITAIELTSAKEQTVETKGYLGSSEQLYMSADNLYLTASHYDAQPNSKLTSMPVMDGSVNTEVFKFSLTGTKVVFDSSAMLKGSVLNQFSMDEHKEFFRIATTEGNMWNDKNPSKNHLFIFDQNMKLTGSVEDLAQGERIYSVRFMGDKAYIVTFRETDPLFVIDVADPKQPKVLGELKIPGFSNYLHPLDENHLIGIGYETTAQKNPHGGDPLIITEGMKLSLFDVTDFANPKEQDTEIIGGRGTYSPVQYDHKALFQHTEKNLFGFPVNIYEKKGKSKEAWDIEYKSSGALIYEITAENGIALKGDLLTKKQGEAQYEEWEKEIQRIIYSGQSVYTLSLQEMNQYDLHSFARMGSVQWK